MSWEALRDKSRASTDKEQATNVSLSSFYTKEPQLDTLPRYCPEEEYLKSITAESVKVLDKKSKRMCNRRDTVLHSLEGKTVQITAISIDIVNSSMNVKILSSEQAGEYYQAFIENTSDSIESYGGYVLKNVGDCVMGFFPCGSYVIENHDSAVLCGLAVSDMIKYSLNPYLTERKMPAIEARISADFGSAKVLSLRSRDGYSAIDLFGGALNSAAKISRYAAPGKMVIGDNLFCQLMEDDTFVFRLINRWDIWGKHNYPVYTVKCSNGSCRMN